MGPKLSTVSLFWQGERGGREAGTGTGRIFFSSDHLLIFAFSSHSSRDGIFDCS